ncbi:hypothetical protein AAG747_18030 [Rapidithrix thailandica]|uniref:Uncharacterized protein n=1 Tax=Rapidithrix thailandica TaxID=413964 RepID=A0AAW9SBT9_9BACT
MKKLIYLGLFVFMSAVSGYNALESSTSESFSLTLKSLSKSAFAFSENPNCDATKYSINYVEDCRGLFNRKIDCKSSQDNCCLKERIGQEC